MYINCLSCPGSVEFFVNEITNAAKDLHEKKSSRAGNNSESKNLESMLVKGHCTVALRFSAFGISLIPPVLISYYNPGLFFKASSKKKKKRPAALFYLAMQQLDYTIYIIYIFLLLLLLLPMVVASYCGWARNDLCVGSAASPDGMEHSGQACRNPSRLPSYYLGAR